ncbi:MAG TPA: transcription termination factor NusA [Bryobacteraceae bacterium]|nr:transcription termination factor NusA [Bryobacteraceae bacterium]
MATIYQSIEILSKEKGIDPQIVVDAVKDAMLVAARKHFRTVEDLVAEFNDQTGALEIFAVKRVVPEVQDAVNEITLDQAQRLNPAAQIDSEIRIPKPTEGLGRISAQTAKQVILQKVREAERETIYAEYSGRVGELVNCVVKRVEGPDLIADLGKTEARLPKKEQNKLESFSVGDRIRCVIRSVDKTGKNAGVIISRAAPELVARLFEQEVPEIYDNTVVIKGCAREAGERTKIAVFSRDRDVDCVGACVGMKGMRVQSIIRELRGEKIDIIEYSEDPVVFATHALSPAKISRVAIVSAADKHMEVIVDDSQLSLAIGKKGQNVRLAAKLLAWKIDIKSEEEKRQEVESAMAALVVPGAPVSALLEHGMPEVLAGKLVEAGIGTVEKLGSMTPEELEEVPGIGPKMVERIQIAVNSYYGQFESEPVLESAQAGGAAAVTEAPEDGSPDAVPGEAEELPESGEAEAGSEPEAAQNEGANDGSDRMKDSE